MTITAARSGSDGLRKPAISNSGITSMIAAVISATLPDMTAATSAPDRKPARRDRAGLRSGALVAAVISGSVALITAAIMLAMPELLIAGFLSPSEPDRAAVMVIGTGLLAAAAVFQLADAGQVMALGLLRAVRDTRAPMIIAGISYWVIGIPASYVLGFPMGLGGIGVWIG